MGVETRIFSIDLVIYGQLAIYSQIVMFFVVLLTTQLGPQTNQIEKLGIVPATEIEFVEEKDRVYIVKKEGPGNRDNRFRKLRGVATVRMTTDEIMALTRKN